MPSPVVHPGLADELRGFHAPLLGMTALPAAPITAPKDDPAPLMDHVHPFAAADVSDYPLGVARGQDAWRKCQQAPDRHHHHQDAQDFKDAQDLQD